MKLGRFSLDLKEKPILISEISGNHNGKLQLAIELVKKASKNGSDLIKLQTYQAENLTLNSSRPEFFVKGKNSLWRNRNLYNLYKKGSTLKEWHYKLFYEAKKNNVECFTSVFDENDIDFLERLKVPAYKIASFESLHFPLIEKLIKTKKPILISTGLCSLKEINDLVNFLKKKKCKNYALLKCTSSYPAASDNLNLSTIKDMRERFNCEIGYSDHSIGYNASIGAIHNGASFIEKHVCLNSKTGIDSEFSLNVNELLGLKSEIYKAHDSRGKTFYGPTKDELPNLQFRRSIYACKNIKRGEEFSKTNIKIIRPSLGLSPKYYNYLLGKKSLSNIKFANPIKFKHVKKKKINNFKPCVIGLGYVGLPLLLSLEKKLYVLGYDINKKRVKDLNQGNDIFGEFQRKDFKDKKIKFSSNVKNLKDCNFFIVTVPTPILKNKKPDLSHLKQICIQLSKIIKQNDIIIFESTVYPGVTENYCIPLLKKKNGFIEGKNFFVGYSPERVNPGDNKHQLKNINKILAYPHKFKRKETLKLYSNLGKKIIYSNSIVEAETAKVVENIQRDVNIGLINELFIACQKLKIDFSKVNSLASTKWNFLKFKPGLVGGHCLPVDPYYFSYICKKNNFNTQITLAGRSINDSMTKIVINKIKDELNFKRLNKKKILICGLTYKKDVADIRNSLSFKIFAKIKSNLIKGYDPLIHKDLAKKRGLIYKKKDISKFDAYVLLTKHKKFSEILKNLKNKTIIEPI